MQEPSVASVMTTRVVTAAPGTPFKELVAAMAEREVSALPVIDGHGCPIGVVSEADALAKQEFHGGRDELPHGDRAGRDRWYRSLGRTASELMTAPVLTIESREPVGTAARMLARKKIRRLRVVDQNGKLVGIVSRRDLLRVYLRDDDAIRDEIKRVLDSAAIAALGRVTVEVVAGVATVDGELDSRGQVASLVRMVQTIPGVVGVHNNLRYL